MPVKAFLSFKPRWLHRFEGGKVGRTDKAHQFKESPDILPLQELKWLNNLSL